MVAIPHGTEVHGLLLLYGTFGPRQNPERDNLETNVTQRRQGMTV